MIKNSVVPSKNPNEPCTGHNHMHKAVLRAPHSDSLRSCACAPILIFLKTTVDS